MTRLQFVVNTTLPAASLLSRPEVFSKPITGLTGFLHAEWLEQVSPGDAIVRISRQDAQEPLRRCSMRQILESPSCGYAAEAWMRFRSLPNLRLSGTPIPEHASFAWSLLPR